MMNLIIQFSLKGKARKSHISLLFLIMTDILFRSLLKAIKNGYISGIKLIQDFLAL